MFCDPILLPPVIGISIKWYNKCKEFYLSCRSLLSCFLSRSLDKKGNGNFLSPTASFSHTAKPLFSSLAKELQSWACLRFWVTKLPSTVLLLLSLETMKIWLHFCGTTFLRDWELQMQCFLKCWKTENGEKSLICIASVLKILLMEWIPILVCPPPNCTIYGKIKPLQGRGASCQAAVLDISHVHLLCSVETVFISKVFLLYLLFFLFLLFPTFLDDSFHRGCESFNKKSPESVVCSSQLCFFVDRPLF